MKDESKALEAIANFKMAFTSKRREFRSSELIFKECSQGPDNRNMIGCPSGIEFMVFFEELLSAAATYPWKAETKMKAAKLAGDYIRFQMGEPQDLLGVTIVAEVLRNLSKNHFLKKSDPKDVEGIYHEIRTFTSARHESQKGHRFAGGCEAFLKNHYEELSLGGKYKEKLKAFLPSLP